MKKFILSALSIFATSAAFAGIDGTYNAEKWAGQDTSESAPYLFSTGESWGSSDEDAESWAATVTAKEGNTYSVYNLLSWEETFDATYDAEANTLTIAGGSILEETYKYIVCGGLSGYTTASSIIAYADKNSSWIYASRTPLDIVLSCAGDKLVAQTPIFIYNDYYHYDGYLGMAYSIYSKLEFAKDAEGVESIIADNDAPAVYYNISGVRVDNPQPGQFLIKKQGNKAQKVVIR